MTAPGGLNYPPDMVPAWEAFMQKAVTAQGLGEEAATLSQGLVSSSAGQVFVAIHAQMTRISAKFEADINTANQLGKVSIQAHGDMMDTDRRVSNLFPPV